MKINEKSNDVYIVNSKIGSILIYTKSGICWKIELTRKFYRESGDNIFTNQIKDYLQKRRKKLTFPVEFSSGMFFTKIWTYLRENVEYGTIITYGKLAQLCGTSPRVVGFAMAANPLPIYIPCHRVVSKNGLGGFTSMDGKGSLEWKEYLIKLESLEGLF
ncbi:MAG: methylated-DNA--[protein]-cysteine S-methyltransferase [Fervidobacterium sp.]